MPTSLVYDTTDDDLDGLVNDGCPENVRQIYNPDGDSLPTGDGDEDSDNDGLLDGVEVKRYSTSPVNSDSDHDGCSDSREAASVNADRSVTSADLSAIAQRFGAYRNGFPNQFVAGPTGVVDINKMTYDFNRDGTIASADLSAVAQRFGACGHQHGITLTASAETFSQCTNTTDDNADWLINNGCPPVGANGPELNVQCANNANDDAAADDTVVNDGCLSTWN